MKLSAKVLSGALLCLAALLWIAPPARADQFNFSFTPNQAACAVGYTCGTDFGSGTFTTDPLTSSPKYYPSGYPVTGITGNINGFPILPGNPGGALSGSGTTLSECCTTNITFFANGQQWSFARVDLAAPFFDFLNNLSTGELEPINLTITTPEPTTLFLLLSAMLIAVAFSMFRNGLTKPRQESAG
jgi:hypothetical protein